MKGKRHSGEQITKILPEAEAAMKVAEVCRKHGVSEWSFYRWRQRRGGIDVSATLEGKTIAESWREEYSTRSPDISSGYLTPAECRMPADSARRR